MGIKAPYPPPPKAQGVPMNTSLRILMIQMSTCLIFERVVSTEFAQSCECIAFNEAAGIYGNSAGSSKLATTASGRASSFCQVRLAAPTERPILACSERNVRIRPAECLLVRRPCRKPGAAGADSSGCRRTVWFFVGNGGMDPYSL